MANDRAEASAAGAADVETTHAPPDFSGDPIGDIASQAKAERWWRSAAESGHVDAQYHLGVCHHLRGEHDIAEHWWCAAARAGHLDAQYNVGSYHYQRGELEAAGSWWRAAAEAGQPEAADTLGWLMCRFPHAPRI